MAHTSSNREWLDWLTRVRLLTITLILAVGVVWPQSVLLSGSSRYFLPLIIFWITLAISALILLKWFPAAGWHGGFQVVCDLAMVSLLVYTTGLHESSFILLYLLIIIVSSILFSRGASAAVAGLCAALLGVMSALAYTGAIARPYTSVPSLGSLRTWLLSNTIGFLAIAYLAGLLAQSLRRKGIELEEKSEELLDLQDFTEDIIHSMRGGLLTTHLEGRILLLNRTGEEILGLRFAQARGQRLQDYSAEFWIPSSPEGASKLSVRKEIDFKTSNGEVRYLGISMSPLRSRES